MAISFTSVTGSSLLGWTITVAGADTSDLVRITRQVDIDGTGGRHYDTVAVRGGDYVAPTGSSMVFTDYEAPLDLQFSYIAETFTVSSLLSPTSSATSANHITNTPTGYGIIHEVITPSNRAVGSVVDIAGWTRAGIVIAEHRILGRRLPVLVTDLTDGRTGTISMMNLDSFSNDFGDGATTPYSVNPGRWRSLFDTGTTYQFRSNWQETGFDDLYFAVKTVKTTRLSHVGTETYAILRFDIDFVEVDRPATTISSLALTGWDDVLAANASWSVVLSKHATWQDVLDNPSL